MAPKTNVGKTYEVNTPEQQQALYDDWATNYEAELCAMGYRIPAAIAAVFTRFVAADTQPILDAGCGAGIQAEPLALLGYGPIVGIDLSDGMMAIAREKNLYSELHQAELGTRLDFADDQFGAVLSAGTITPKHAPPESFEELIRVSRKGAHIVFSMRDDPAQEPEYPQAVQHLADEGRWKWVFETDGFASMPYGEPEISQRIYVYEGL